MSEVVSNQEEEKDLSAKDLAFRIGRDVSSSEVLELSKKLVEKSKNVRGKE